jgi:hypothetical protein
VPNGQRPAHSGCNAENSWSRPRVGSVAGAACSSGAGSAGAFDPPVPPEGGRMWAGRLAAAEVSGSPAQWRLIGHRRRRRGQSRAGHPPGRTRRPARPPAGLLGGLGPGRPGARRDRLGSRQRLADRHRPGRQATAAPRRGRRLGPHRRPPAGALTTAGSYPNGAGRNSQGTWNPRPPARQPGHRHAHTPADNGPNSGDRLLDWSGSYDIYTHCNAATAASTTSASSAPTCRPSCSTGPTGWAPARRSSTS